MAMELEFWENDGPNGEQLDFARRVAAWEILGAVERYRTPAHVMIGLRHTSRQRGEWIIWVRPGYVSGTAPAVGAVL
jgi:hypothetical protein